MADRIFQKRNGQLVEVSMEGGGPDGYVLPVATSDKLGGVKVGANLTMTDGVLSAKDTTYSVFVKSGSGAKSGLVPSPGTTEGTSKYLREDGTWQTPPDTNTDTHWTSHLYAGASGTAANAATANGDTTLVLADNSTVRSNIKLKGSGATTVTSDASGNITISSTDNNTTYANFVKSGTGAKAGLVPSPGTTAGTTKYLREDGTWQVPPDTNTDTHWTTHLYAGASGTAANATTTNGNTTLVLADNSTVRANIKLKGSGATTVTSDASGNITISSTDTDTKYTHPSHTAKSSGLYKVTVDSLGHVTAAAAVTKADITALGIPGSDTNTTYGAATGSALGLVKIGSNISVSSGTISLSKANVTGALGYTPPTTNTTYSNFTKATASAAGKAGLVPAPAKGKQTCFLKGNATWTWVCNCENCTSNCSYGWC